LGTKFKSTQVGADPLKRWPSGLLRHPQPFLTRTSGVEMNKRSLGGFFVAVVLGTSAFAQQRGVFIDPQNTAFPIDNTWNILFPRKNDVIFYKFYKPVHPDANNIFVRTYNYSENRLSILQIEFHRTDRRVRFLGYNDYNLKTGIKDKTNSDDNISEWKNIEPSSVVSALWDRVEAAKKASFLYDKKGLLLK